MLESQVVSVSIRRPWAEVYEAIWRPQSFARWASGLSESPLIPQPDGSWRATSAAASVVIRFTGHNRFGVMDHQLLFDDGRQVYVPMRVIANGEGADVALTLFRQPGQPESQFRHDLDWVRRDLAALQALLE